MVLQKQSATRNLTSINQIEKKIETLNNIILKQLRLKIFAFNQTKRKLNYFKKRFGNKSVIGTSKPQIKIRQSTNQRSTLESQIQSALIA